MTSAIREKFKINHFDVIPEFTPAALQIFKARNFQICPQLVTLKAKVSTWVTLRSQHREAILDPVKDKNLGIFFALALTIMIAGGIFGVKYCPHFVGKVVIAISTFALNVVFSKVFQAHYYGKTRMIYLLFSPLVPLIGAFGNVTRAKKAMKEQASDVRRDVLAIREFYSRKFLVMKAFDNWIARQSNPAKAVWQQWKNCPMLQLDLILRAHAATPSARRGLNFQGS